MGGSIRDKESIGVTDVFKTILNYCVHKADSTFYNRSIKSKLYGNDTVKYSKHSKIKYLVGERFIRTLNNRMYKDLRAVSKNAYISKLDEIVKKHNNLYHITMKIKPADITPGTYIDLTNTGTLIIEQSR